MRYVKRFAFLIVGFVCGALVSGFVTFQYMARFGIDWNQWAESRSWEGKATDAIANVAVLKKFQSGDLYLVRFSLEMDLVRKSAELALMKRDGRDPNGETTKALSAIRAYRHANPWSSGSAELDKGTSETLDEALGPDVAR